MRMQQVPLSLTHDGFVYFVRAKGTDFFKIGFTRRPIEHRLAEIATHTPYGLECLVYGPGTRDDERGCHHQLRRYRLHNEWFEIKPEDFDTLLAEQYGIDTESKAEAAIEDLRARGLWE